MAEGTVYWSMKTLYMCADEDFEAWAALVSFELQLVVTKKY